MSICTENPRSGFCYVQETANPRHFTPRWSAFPRDPQSTVVFKPCGQKLGRETKPCPAAYPNLVGLIHESQQSRKFPTQLPSGKGGRLRQSTDPGFGLDAGAERSRDDYVSPAGEEP